EPLPADIEVNKLSSTSSISPVLIGILIFALSAIYSSTNTSYPVLPNNAKVNSTTSPPLPLHHLLLLDSFPLPLSFLSLLLLHAANANDKIRVTNNIDHFLMIK